MADDDFRLFDPAKKSAPDTATTPDNDYHLFGGASAAPAPAATTDETDKPYVGRAGDTDFKSKAKNILTTITKGVSHIPGAFGDVNEALKFAEAGARSVFSDRGWREHLDDINRQQEAAHAKGQLQPMTGEEIYKRHIEPTTGTYEPTSELGKAGRAVGEAAIPGLVAGPMGALSGALAGGASHVGENYLGIKDPYQLMALSILTGGTPAAASKLWNKVHTPKLTPEQREIEAGKRILGVTQDPSKAIAEGRSRSGLPDEPLADATNDPHHGLTQDTFLAARHPDVMKSVQSTRGRQNEAAQTAIGALAPIDADPVDVSRNFQQHATDLEAARDALPRPTAPPADASGAALRDTAATKYQGIKDDLNKLKKSIDPEGAMNVWTQDVADHAREQLASAESRPFKSRSPLGDDMLQMASKLGEISKFSDLVDLDQSISAAMKKAGGHANPDQIGLSQLIELKGKVKDAINNAIEHQHRWEQKAVQNGDMHTEDTLAARLERERADWYERRKAAQGAASATGTGPAVASGESTVRPVPGTGQSDVETRPGSSGVAGGVPGGESPQPNLTPETAGRLALFNEGYGMSKDIYGKGPVGEALRTDFGGQPKTLNADVAGKAFVPGPKGYETAKMWLTAGGDNAKQALGDIAIGRLQADLKGKPLDQKTLDAWRSKHADALRALDEAQPGFSEQFNNTASAHTNIQNFENTKAAEFLTPKRTDGTPAAPLSNDSVVTKVGELMGRKDGAEHIKALMDQASQAPNSEAIVAGLRRAGSTWLDQKFRSADRLPGETGEAVPIYKGKALREFIDTHGDMLHSLFEPQAVDQMAKVADQISRSTTVRTLEGGSQTAGRNLDLLKQQLVASLAKDASEQSMSMASALGVVEIGREIGRALFGSGTVEGAMSALGTLGFSKAWQRALEKTTHGRQAQQTDITNIMARGFASREVGLGLMEKALNEQGVPNQRAFDNLARALIGVEAEQQREQEREPHASGGAVGNSEHIAAAKHMIGLVDRVRKRDAKRTKPLLKTDDSTVARALAIAGRSI